MVPPVFKVLEPVLRSPGADGLPEFLSTVEKSFAEFARSRTGFLAQLSDYVLTGSGKRVRPGLVFVASRFGSADPAAVRETALAVELIHIATLVHDDLVDDALMRRQRPTVGVKFGEGAAVLLGDYVYAQAFQRLGALGRPDLVRLYADTTMVMCEGEIGQYESRYRFTLSESEYLDFLGKKTASLMAAACRSGALLAGLNEAQARALETFGEKLGVAFQVVDDLLDVEGDEAVVGKTLHTDLTHGKMTLPLILYSARLSSDKERQALFELLRNPNGHLRGLIERVRASGVLADCRTKVQQLLNEADGALKALPDVPARRLLADIALRLSSRQV
ncbi:MAG TPA: polyprenyl synthetase family protein [Elusimicrobiota bacterium]|nr:polyprenyl synthetase family protein [Elusimicrobiota bacterium]HNF58899.1 polyprenyl synthetase family protein [Elusimicrobiota bacterium]HNI57611.1 polyprenyl synthetase family protein [Elusimicrobiota bacterium]